jgi:hypothetical protein
MAILARIRARLGISFFGPTFRKIGLDFRALEWDFQTDMVLNHTDI